MLSLRLSMRLLRSDWLKLRRTPPRWAILLTPAAYALLLLWYFSTYRVTPELADKIYTAFFEVWTSFMPLAAGLISGLYCLQEEQAGRFSGVLGLPASRPLIYTNKLGMLVAIHACSLLLSVTILALGMKYGLHMDQINANLFYRGALLAAIGSLPLLALHLWISFAFGLGASAGIGGAGLLLAAIVGATSIGDSLWPVVLWAWPVRLTMSPMDPAVLAAGLPPALLLFAVLAVGGSVWFRRWEGRKHED